MARSRSLQAIAKSKLAQIRLYTPRARSDQTNRQSMTSTTEAKVTMWYHVSPFTIKIYYPGTSNSSYMPKRSYPTSCLSARLWSEAEEIRNALLGHCTLTLPLRFSFNSNRPTHVWKLQYCVSPIFKNPYIPTLWLVSYNSVDSSALADMLFSGFV